jgi:hypothetical protein
VPLASNRKVVRQFAGNPKGREHNHHERRRLQRTKGTVRISDGCSLPCVFNGPDPHMIRNGGCSARATTQSENGHRPAKARDRPASAIRGALASPSLCRFDRSQSFLTSHLTTDFGDNGRAAYRRSIDGGVTESLNDFSSVFRRSSSAPPLQACHEGRLLTQNCCPKLKPFRWNPSDLCERALDMPKYGQRYCAETLCISSAPPTYEGNGEGGRHRLR